MLRYNHSHTYTHTKPTESNSETIIPKQKCPGKALLKTNTKYPPKPV